MHSSSRKILQKKSMKMRIVAVLPFVNLKKETLGFSFNTQAAREADLGESLNILLSKQNREQGLKDICTPVPTATLLTMI